MVSPPWPDAEGFPDPGAAPLQIGLFGPFSVWVRGTPLPHLRTRKGEWLLALLVLHADRPLDRGWLAGLLWPNVSTSQSLASLRKAHGKKHGNKQCGENASGESQCELTHEIICLGCEAQQRRLYINGYGEVRATLSLAFV